MTKTKRHENDIFRKVSDKENIYKWYPICQCELKRTRESNTVATPSALNWYVLVTYWCTFNRRAGLFCNIILASNILILLLSESFPKGVTAEYSLMPLLSPWFFSVSLSEYENNALKFSAPVPYILYSSQLMLTTPLFLLWQHSEQDLRSRQPCNATKRPTHTKWQTGFTEQSHF